MSGRVANFADGPIPKKNRLQAAAAAKRRRSPAHLAFLKALPCVVSGSTGDVDAHHLTIGRAQGGLKVDDSLCVPLAASLHRPGFPEALHAVGERNFWAKRGIQPFWLAEDLWYASGDMPRGEAIVAFHREAGRRRRILGLPLPFAGWPVAAVPCAKGSD